ncbi:hypothetical protein ACGFJ7_23020 [Actinoplanes sp. NPDC048988]|uniref:hypothetical protein n=1 Tax=Actinoplanes sp. NPDC048988 TaxID=3363901 RepID=UPI003713DFDD
MRQLADSGDPAAIALLPVAANLEQSAQETENLPLGFWTWDFSSRSGSELGGNRTGSAEWAAGEH